jgi:hypothetical protein
MEPTDLKPTPPDDAALEAWLRTNRSLPPLPDAGFSNRVLTALPRSFQRRVQRSVGCIAAVILGSALALAGVLGAGHGVTDDLFVSLNNPLAAPPALVAFVVAAGSVWFAFRHRVRRLARW